MGSWKAPRPSVLGVRVRNQPPRVETAVGFLHGVDRVEEVFGGVVGSDDADLAVAEGPAVVEVSCDVAAVEISGFLAPRGG